MTKTPIDRPINVTWHACERYALRGRTSLATGYDAHEIEQEIKSEIEKAIKGGRVKNHKLPTYRLYGEKKNRQLTDGELFMYTEDKRMAWIVKKHPHEYAVITTLTPTWASEEAA